MVGWGRAWRGQGGVVVVVAECCGQWLGKGAHLRTHCREYSGFT